jgi:hypothetical protein
MAQHGRDRSFCSGCVAIDTAAGPRAEPVARAVIARQAGGTVQTAYVTGCMSMPKVSRNFDVMM